MTQDKLLAERAARFQQQILGVATGPGGMIIAFPRFDTRRPFQEGEPPHWYLTMLLDGVWGDQTPKPTVAEWLYGENTLWATGWLLWSQILRYRATQDADALQMARKCFHDLHNLFRLCRSLEPGLLGKPHGGRPGPTTSYDQAASPVLFYAYFAKELGTPEEKAAATENMALHGDYYLRRNWVMNHHGNHQRIVDPAHTSTLKYLVCLHEAYVLSGETRFRDAAFHYVQQIIDSGKLPWPATPYEINHNLYYWAFLCDYWRTTELSNATDWLGCIRAYWTALQTALDAEGIVRAGPYDTVHHTFTPYTSQWVPRQEAGQWPTLDGSTKRVAQRWVSGACYPNRALNSAFAAALALLVHGHGIDTQAVAVARRTLLRLDDATLRWWWDDGALPEELKPLLNIFAPEVAAVWLIAYWTGRLQGVW